MPILIGTPSDKGGRMVKVVCVLYDDPVGGHPRSYARDDIPKLERYPSGQTLPTPKAIDTSRANSSEPFRASWASANSSRAAGTALS